MGSDLWKNYSVQVDIKLFDRDGYAMVGGRTVHNGKYDIAPEGYNIKLNGDGSWQLRNRVKILSSGRYDGFRLNTFYSISIHLLDNEISGYLDGKLVTSVVNNHVSSGQAVLGSGYNEAVFANLVIKPADESVQVSCIRFSDKDDRIVYEGTWECLDGRYDNYGRSLTGSCVPGSKASFSFQATAISMIGNRGNDCGMAKIYMDGLYLETIDTYSAVDRDPVTEEAIPNTRTSIYTVSGLCPGMHHMEIIVDENKNTASADRYVCIDALEFSGGPGLCTSGVNTMLSTD